MTTLVERLRQIVAAEDDDYFKDETLLYYLNRSLRKVVSEMIKREKQRFFIINQDGSRQRIDITGTLRALDRLRSKSQLQLNSQSFSQIGGNYTGEVTFSVSLDDINYLQYDEQIGLRELSSDQLHLISWGVKRPTKQEGYYYVINTSQTTCTLKIYLHEEPDKQLSLYYFKQPNEINLSDVDIIDLPVQLNNAVLYGAAVMMNIQESVKSMEGSSQSLQFIYAEELNRGTY